MACTGPKSGVTGSSDENRLMLLWIRKPLKRKSAPISAVSADGHVFVSGGASRPTSRRPARAVAIGLDGQIAGTGETRSGDLKVTLGAADLNFGNDFDVVVAQLP